MRALRHRSGAARRDQRPRPATPARWRVPLVLMLILAALFLVQPAAGEEQPDEDGQQPTGEDSAEIVAVQIEGAITPVMHDHLRDAIDNAGARGASAVLVELDTPGGQLETTRDMVDAMLAADVPVIVHVTPSGARAGSAGTFLTYAAHVAAMAPGTTIGAATPVDAGGGEVLDKIVEDSASYLEALAEERDRDEEFAIASVRDGTSITASAAAERGAVDLLAPDRAELLDGVDGTSVELGDGQEVTISSARADVVEQDLGLGRQVLQIIANPDLAFIFLGIGALAILFEIANPGAGIGGAIGGVMLILAFYSLSVLPTNWAGIALLVLAAGLLIGELFAPGTGALAGGGAIALAAAGLLLFDGQGGLGVSWWVLVPTVLLAGVGAVAVGVVATRTQRRPSDTTGPQRLIGRTALVEHLDDDPRRGQIFVDGARWRVRAAGALAPNQRVRVVDVDGLELRVEPAPEGLGEAPPPPGDPQQHGSRS